MVLQVISDLRLATNRNAVLLCQNPNLQLSVRNQIQFHNLNYKITSCPDCITFKTKNYKGIRNTNKRNLYVGRFENSLRLFTK